MNRRQFLSGLGAGAAALTILPGLGEATPGQRRRRRRRVRRRIRRRIRRRAVRRMVRGRPFWVVPVGLVVGWELLHEDRVVIVREVKVIEVEGVKTEVAVVVDPNAKVEPGKAAPFEEIPIVREDNKENSEELEGTRLADDDKSSPGREVEIEEEVEVDE